MTVTRDPSLALDLEEARVPSSERLRAAYELGKPNLSAMVAISGLLGFRVGNGELGLVPLFGLLSGLWLTSFGACGLNMVVERDLDARMKRTEKRPIPSGRVGPIAAVLISVAAYFLGFAVLGATFNSLAAMLSLLTAAVYLLIYTPLKAKGPIATWIGAFPGAMPPVIGWAAATGRIELPAVALFGILFFWQIPHFFALAWMYREDYRRGGFDFVPEGSDQSIGVQMTLSAALLLAPTVALSLLGSAGWLFALGGMALGLGYLFVTLRLMGARSASRARSVFLWSISYLPLLFVVLLVDGALR